MRPQLRRISGPAHLHSSLVQLVGRRFPAHPLQVLALVRHNQRPRVSTLARQISSFSRASTRKSAVVTTRFSQTLTGKGHYSPEPHNLHAGSRGATHLESNLFYTLIGAAALAAVGFIFYNSGREEIVTKSADLQEAEELFDLMATEIPPGRPETLTPEQEEKLRKLWTSIFQLCGVADEEASAAEVFASKEEPATDAAAPKKKKFGGFRRHHDKSGTSTPTSEASFKHSAEDDKYGQTKQFYETLANETPESIRATIWSMVKHDHPDALVLRFLRARKWDVEKALVMFVSTMNWRHTEMHVDTEIMNRGDYYAVEDEKTNSATSQVSKDFMAQLRMGKSFLHGVDKHGRPICVVRVRLHRQGEQCEESLEKYTVYTIETARMVLTPPVDTACIVFDMTGFSMANMDYTPVKFMIKCFEANYPECLGAVLVHKAPWLFQGIWKVIRGWLDPVVAAKVHFTNNRTDLEEFIEPGHIIKELEGKEDWSYNYVEPTPGENDKLKDTETRDRLLAAREELVKQFEQATRDWIKNPEGEDAKAIKAHRTKLAAQLREDYWNLDPYLRARSIYDREGSMQGGGKTDWYNRVVPSNGQTTAADDVD